MGKGTKRKSNESAIAASVEDVDLLNGWVQKLLARSDLVNIIAALVNEGDVTTSQIKKARSVQPSFSSSQWDGIAPSFGLPSDLSLAEFDQFSIDVVLLPPSFHVAIAEAAWHVQDVYQEWLAQVKEEAQVTSFDVV